MNEDSNEDDKKIELTPLLISTISMNCIIIIITIYLLFLYIKSKEFHSYSCGNVLILSFIILIDNIFRLIPISRKEKYKTFHYLQAFILASLDKFILLILTVQMFIIYMGIMKTDFYYQHKKAIFYFPFIICLSLSFIIGGLYLLFGLEKYGIYYYVQGNNIKEICDTIFISLFLILNTFFSGIIILNIALRKEDIEKGMINENDYEHNLSRMILMFLANSIMYIEQFLIVYDKLPVPDEYIDLVYIITCLITNLIYAINSVVIKETKKIFCKRLLNVQEKRINTYKNKNTFCSEEMSSCGASEASNE